MLEMEYIIWICKISRNGRKLIKIVNKNHQFVKWTDSNLFNECANLFEPEYVESHVQYVKEWHPLNLLKIATFQQADDELQT